MSEVGKGFKKAFGKPDPSVPPMKFEDEGEQRFWTGLHKEIGSGWFKTGFLYLFGEELKSLQPCLKAWSFLLPPSKDRMIIGKNAYGALLILDNSGKEKESVFVLDPFLVALVQNDNWVFSNVLGSYLPDDELPGFLEQMPYLEWMDENELEQLEFKDMLAPKIPKDLGGKLTPDNFIFSDIVEYYESRGKIYANAAKGAKKAKRS